MLEITQSNPISSNKILSTPNDDLWFKDAIIYELSVRAFADSDGDGIGDFVGITEKLDYLKDLGVTAIWLLPFFPSPLRDDGYDISDYTEVNSIFGHLDDFRKFLSAAHDRNIRVIIELILNHTSDQHPWFQRARLAPHGSAERDFYVWSDTLDRYKEARIIFQDFENSNWSWDSVANAYYWHRFYCHQPDLNYDNPAVQEAAFNVMDFWLDLGVDGLRLDAVPYLYEREGTNCENLAETHAFLKLLRRHIDEKYGGNRMLLAEANQWPEDAVAYFGEGDECHMDFHFPLMPRLFMAVQMEDRFPIIDILEQTPTIPDNCQWAIFLRNHDELTLEMVTDEDRDYMYRMYARDPQARINLGIRRRLAPLLGNNRQLIELMNGLLFSLPGTPVIYYGDEIGMGDNIYLGDRNGVRTPMQWSADRNAGFSRSSSQKLYLPVIVDAEYHYESTNVEAQRGNSNSLWWAMKRLIGVRKSYQAFGRGSFEFLKPDNSKVLAYIRAYGNEKILVVANLSRHMQCVNLDLAVYEGLTPIDIFGRSKLPIIGSHPYFLTLASHTFYWLSLEPMQKEHFQAKDDPNKPLPLLTLDSQWQGVFQGQPRSALESILKDYLPTCRWFGDKARTIKCLQVQEVIPINYEHHELVLTLLHLDFSGGDSRSYLLPLTYITGEQAMVVRVEFPKMMIAQVQIKGEQEDGLLCDGLADGKFLNLPLYAIAHQSRFKGSNGELSAVVSQRFASLYSYSDSPLQPRLLRAEQSNSSVIYGDRFIFKLYRKLEEGTNPDLEIGRYLTDQQVFEHVPPVVGALEYRQGKSEPITLGILQGFVPNEGDAWRYTLDELDRYFERMLVQRLEGVELALPVLPTIEWATLEVPDLAYELIGNYLESARLLGQRSAEMHGCLAAASSTNVAFAPETFSMLYQRSLYQSMRNLVGQTLPLLAKQLGQLPPGTNELAALVVGQHSRIIDRFQLLLKRKINALRIRCHGDFHLGQILYTGKDFVIIDFEGEPARSLSERKLKRSPLRDVAGLLRSFHYAVIKVQRQLSANGLVTEENQHQVARWGGFWRFWVTAAYLKSYLGVSSQSPFLSLEQEELQILLNAYLLEKAIYELGYELNNRPDWADIPLQGILELLEDSPSL